MLGELNAVLPLKLSGRHYGNNIGYCDTLFSSFRHFGLRDVLSEVVLVAMPSELARARQAVRDGMERLSHNNPIRGRIATRVPTLQSATPGSTVASPADDQSSLWLLVSNGTKILWARGLGDAQCIHQEPCRAGWPFRSRRELGAISNGCPRIVAPIHARLLARYHPGGSRSSPDRHPWSLLGARTPWITTWASTLNEFGTKVNPNSWFR
jgi:hypothetical protein